MKKEPIFIDIKSLIEQARHRVSSQINTELVALYWNIGSRIRREVLKEKRAHYGREIIPTLSKQLTMEYGRGYSQRNLFNMMYFYDIFPNFKILQTLSAKLGWSHFLELIQLEDPLKRDFYTNMCRLERWSVRTLRSNINRLLFERTAISKKPGKYIKQEIKQLKEKDRLTPDLVFRDPYVLDFLKLDENHAEKDLEAAILQEMEKFILELGMDFSFIARQKRITVDGVDYYLDLLFFHRKLKRLIAIDLKLGKFKAAYKGQMELYLRWLEKHEKQKEEKSPMGLVLCADQSYEHVELLKLDKSGIRVATYLTEFPSKDLIEKKLHQARQYLKAGQLSLK